MHKSTKQALQSIVGVAGQRVTSDMRNAAQTKYVQLRASCSYQVTGGGTRVINKGSVWGIWDQIGISDGGRDAVLVDGRSLRALTEYFAPSILSATRLGGVGVATTVLTESARIIFGNWRQAQHMATAFRETNPAKKLQLFATLRADGGAGGVMTGGAVTLTVPTIAAEQMLDDLSAGNPDFIPLLRQDVITVAASNPLLTYNIQTPNYIRGILIQTDSDQGEVGDIISALALRMSGRDFIGPGQVAWDNLLRDQENEFGGAVYNTGVSYGQSAYYWYDFAEGGRLSNIMPGNANNLRLELNVAPSGQAGVTVSRIRFTFVEYQRTPGLVVPKLPYNP